MTIFETKIEAKGAERWLVDGYNMAGNQDAEQQQASLCTVYSA